MKQFLSCAFIGGSLVWGGFANAETSQKCPSSFQTLANSLAQDLPDYLNRTYIRLGISQQAVVSSSPDLNPLPIATWNKNLSPPHQIFVSILGGKTGQPKNQVQNYWLFISKTNRGWGLAMAFTKVGNSSPIDVSDGAIADATRTWLRNQC